MKRAIVVDASDLKGILAEYFGVKPEDVIKSQYSYTVVTEDDGAYKNGTGSDTNERGAVSEDH